MSTTSPTFIILVLAATVAIFLIPGAQPQESPVNQPCSGAPNVTDCETARTGLICSETTGTCSCRTGVLLIGTQRQINMEWSAEMEECAGAFGSACDSAGDGSGQVQCLPGSICAQLPCEKEGFGLCIRLTELETYDMEEECGRSGGSRALERIGLTLVLAPIVTQIRLSLFS